MTPSAATAAGRAPGLRRSPAPRVPRRVSGPTHPARPHTRPGAGGPRSSRPAPARSSVALGAAARRLRALPDARLLDRLVRGRAWIAIVAVALMGIVFMQVSMLQLNAGIGRAVTSADTLERQNSTLRAGISELDSGERIQKVATELGMVMPAAGDVRFLDARQADGARAAANVTAPAPAATRAAAVQTPTGQAAAAAVQPQQPVQAAQTAAPPATATTATTATPTTTPAPAATTQTQTSPPPSPTPATAAAPTPGAAAAPPVGTSAGGVSAPAVQR
jgi:cell division protein FtsL